MGKYQFKYRTRTPDRSETELLAWVDNRITEMDTDYRSECIEAADWARKEYDSIPQQRINNLDLFKTGLSRTVVNHRLSMMYDNPSESIYKAVEESDQYKVDILTQLDKYDKNVSRFNSTQQDLFQTAEVEGTAIALTCWREEIENGETIGAYSTLTEKISLKDFYWDPAGVNINGSGAFTCNDVAYEKVYSLSEFRRLFDKEPYKNIDTVLPGRGRYGQDWKQNWEESRDNSGDYVCVMTYMSKKFYENGTWKDKEIVVANGVLIYEGELRVPYIQNEKWLPFSKLVGIPTGAFCGLGIPTLIRHPQEVLDRMLTMAEAQAELAVNPVMFYNATGELLPEEIVHYPGAAYPYKGTGQGIQRDIQFVPHPDITQGAQYTIDKMLQFITMTTGVDIQALLDTSGELAIQTQNKREIQEKILKMSVIWNETHGLYDLAVIRLGLMQKYYPAMRVHRIFAANGDQTTDTNYPTIPVDGFKVQEDNSRGGKKITRLVKSPGTYSSMSISPDDIQFNVDVIVESSQVGAGMDTVKQNKFDKLMAGILSNPAEAQTMDWNKVSKYRIKTAGFKEKDLLAGNFVATDNTEHTARKEFKALLMSDVVQFDPTYPEDYNPEDYIFVFRDMMKLPEYKSAPVKIKQLIQARLAEHMKNFADPFFKDNIAKQQKEKQEAQGLEQALMASSQQKGHGGTPTKTEQLDTTLATRTKSEAAKIGAASRESIRSN